MTSSKTFGSVGTNVINVRLTAERQRSQRAILLLLSAERAESKRAS